MTDPKLKTYGASALVAAAAGLAAALLFVLAARASLATVFLGYFAPMPIMIAALGYGLSFGAAAAAVGGAFVAALYHPALGLLFILSIGAPAVLVSAAALLAPTGEDRRGRDFAPTAALLASAVVAATAVAGALVYFCWRQGGFEALMADAVKEGQPFVEAMLKDAKAGGAVDAARLTRYIAMVAPVGIAASQILTMTINLYLAGRVSLISGNLPRRWPSVADDLAIPPVFGALFAAACGLTFVGGLAGVVAGIVAAVFGMAFALQGLALAHVYSRGAGLRPAILFSVYALIALLPPWPFLFLALAGLADAAFHLRARRTASRSVT